MSDSLFEFLALCKGEMGCGEGFGVWGGVGWSVGEEGEG